MAGRDRIGVFDGLRGLLALSVVGFHVGLCLDRPWLFGHGALAVDIFFVMSGVVIARAYGAALGSADALPGFARARIVRLYPLYAVGSLAGAAAATIPVLFGSPGRLPVSLPAALGMAAVLAPLSLGVVQSFPLNGPSWSLMSEGVANLAYAVTVRHPRLQEALLLLGAVVVATAAPLHAPLLQGGVWSNLPVGVYRAVFGFMAGVLLQRAAAGGMFARAPRVLAAVPLAAAALLVLVPRSAADKVFDPVAVLVLSPLVVAAALACEARSSRTFAALGAMSYPLYVIHTPVIMLIRNLAALLAIPERYAAAEFSLAAGLSVLAAALIARFVEPAFTRWAKRLTSPAPAYRPPLVAS